MEKGKLIEEWNQKLKDIASSEDTLTTDGEVIREIFYAMREMDFDLEEMERVFEDVDISDEKLAHIEAMENKKR